MTVRCDGARKVRVGEKRPSEVAAPCNCSIVLSEGEMIDLQGIESWLGHTEQSRPRLGRGVKRAWMKTLARILDQSNDRLHGRGRSDSK